MPRLPAGPRLLQKDSRRHSQRGSGCESGDRGHQGRNCPNSSRPANPVGLQHLEEWEPAPPSSAEPPPHAGSHCRAPGAGQGLCAEEARFARWSQVLPLKNQRAGGPCSRQALRLLLLPPRGRGSPERELRPPSPPAPKCDQSWEHRF